jgi:hypothetical protein
MSLRVDRVNRALLALLALLCLAAGVVTLLLGFDVFGDHTTTKPLLPHSVRSFGDRNAGWFWIAVGVAVGLLVLALLWLLLRQTATSRLGDPIELEPDPPRARGRTRLQPGALSNAIDEEVESYREVARANARMRGTTRKPVVALNIRLADTADLSSIRARIEDTAVAHLRQAASRPDLPVRLRLELAATRRTDIH